MPNREVAGELSVSLHCSVKYEKSSVDLMECERSQLPVSQAPPLSLSLFIHLSVFTSQQSSQLRQRDKVFHTHELRPTAP